MSILSARLRDSDVETTRVATAPIATADGRPFVCIMQKTQLWFPDPPREGDPVYHNGERVGTFHGDYGEPGEWYIVTDPINDLLAATIKDID